VTSTYKQLISGAVGKCLRCDAHSKHSDDCEFHKEVLKYFDSELQKMGRNNIVKVEPELKVYPMYEVQMKSSIDTAQLLVIGMSCKIHILNRVRRSSSKSSVGLAIPKRDKFFDKFKNAITKQN